ncbi:Glucosamine-phosphate N-acetyltransferase-like protein [Tieghemiomyces parasiticus]|uniref:Glucosamine 6-phosphate N-acetyltransferase n=1 Tax=Tieghemiomyces parasiticus TaxID=78921 RepID=A0A9W8DTE5_9FUNG|nr:Glucosamine-phosphate N-acetyltransferase-like protein [Tieghemiomyces parasiticus]
MLSESSNPMTSPSVDQQVSEASNGLAKLKVANAVVPRPLFSADLISPEVQALLPTHYIIRPLSEDDFAKGFFDCLAQLTVTGDVSLELFKETFATMLDQKANYVVVIEDKERSAIVACGTLVQERKFIRNCGKIGHIEDIVVSSTERGKRLGMHMIHQLKHVAREIGCYKVILNCHEKNVEFYKKCGLVLKDVQMTEYFDQPTPKTNL